MAGRGGVRGHLLFFAVFGSLLFDSLLGAAPAVAQTASWRGTVTVREEMIIRDFERSIEKRGYYTLEIVGPSSDPNLLRAEVTDYVITYEDEVGGICPGRSYYLPAEVIGPRPANPPYADIGVAVELSEDSYSVRATGINTEGTMHEQSTCLPDGSHTAYMFLEHYVWAVALPLPEDGVTFAGSHEYRVPPLLLTMEWDLRYDDTPRADLEVTKTLETAQPTAGAPLTYRITVRNLGPDDADDVVLREFGGPGLLRLDSLTSESATCDRDTATCTLSRLASGGSFSAIAVLTSDLRATSATNNVGVASGTEDPVTANNSAQLTTALARPPPFVLTVATGFAAPPPPGGGDLVGGDVGFVTGSEAALAAVEWVCLQTSWSFSLRNLGDTVGAVLGPANPGLGEGIVFVPPPYDDQTLDRVINPNERSLDLTFGTSVLCERGTRYNLPSYLSIIPTLPKHKLVSIAHEVTATVILTGGAQYTCTLETSRKGFRLAGLKECVISVP